MKMPAWSGCRLPQMAGSWADGATGFDFGTDRSEPCSGPPSSNRYWPP